MRGFEDWAWPYLGVVTQDYAGAPEKSRKKDMPKLCDGDNGKKNTSAIGIVHIALCVV